MEEVADCVACCTVIFTGEEPPPPVGFCSGLEAPLLAREEEEMEVTPLCMLRGVVCVNFPPLIVDESRTASARELRELMRACGSIVVVTADTVPLPAGKEADSHGVRVIRGKIRIQIDRSARLIAIEAQDQR